MSSQSSKPQAPCKRCGSTLRNTRGRCTACQSRYFSLWYERAKRTGFNERRAAKVRSNKAVT